MSSFQTALSSARFNRYLMWFSGLVLAAGVAFLAIKLVPGGDKQSAKPDVGFRAQLPARRHAALERTRRASRSKPTRSSVRIERLREAGIGAELEVMQSSGGTLTPATAAASRPLVESGPAAGVMACSYLGRLTGRHQLISLDMGGTTAKAAIVEDGRPVRTSEYEVGAGINLSSKLVKGGGHRSSSRSSTSPRSVPAAAASSPSTTSAGHRRPRQRRLGAGPCLLRHWRRRTTLTDALLGARLLNATQLGGGAITLDPQRSRDVLNRVVATTARPMGRGRLLRNPACLRSPR